jgi:pimeloyl-ACP methyl ester carboxylesterase
MKKALFPTRLLISVIFTLCFIFGFGNERKDRLLARPAPQISTQAASNQISILQDRYRLNVNRVTGSITALDSQYGITYNIINGKITEGQTTVLGKTVRFYAVRPLNLQHPTIFITHGYVVGGKSNISIANLYAQRYPNHNVIVMDWGSLSKDGIIPVISNGFINKEYQDAADASIAVGAKMGQLILSLRLDPNQVTLLGHSLGARASQYAAESIRQQSQNRQQIQTLILLDPAGPGFQPRPWDWVAGGWKIRRLPKEQQAGRTIVIHTSTRWGDERRLGNVDVYVRKPTRTPAFQIDDHSYANQYWRELVSNGQDQILINSTAARPARLPHVSRIVY